MPDPAALREALPGLLHPGLGGWEIVGDSGSTGFRIRRRGSGPIDLKAIHLRGADPAGVGALAVKSSPSRGAPWDRDLANGFRGGGVEPWWRVEFERPGPASLWLLAQPGERAEASYDLEVTVLGDDGAPTVTTVNDDPAVVSERRAAWRERAVRLPEAGEAISHVLEDVTSALAGGPARGPAARDRLLDRIADGAADRGGTDLADYLERAAGVIPSVIDKAEAARDRADRQRREAATALMFAHVLINRGGEVRRPMLSEFGRVLDTPEAMDRVEAAVDALHARAGGDTRLHPILFRKHTLSGSRLRADPDRHLDAMAEVERAVAAAGYQAAIGYGTFLGAVRDGDFIAHDDDLDMLVMLNADADGAEAETSALAQALAAQGFEIKSFGETRQPVLQLRKGEGPPVDLFPISRRGDSQVALYMHKLKLARLGREAVLPFKPIEFLGRTFLGPADPSAFLEARYGADWRTPIRWTSRAGPS
ncbi:hypothetical protein [Brevundimonas sp.]|uniref:hypothetical protein n=1 Tax=Brevundimonas sp. TaxID=1871086 RepID=UPI0035B255CB